MDRDKVFGGVDAYRLRNGAFLVIDKTQDEPEHQLQAIGLAAASDRAGVRVCVRRHGHGPEGNSCCVRAHEERTVWSLRQYV